MTDSLLLIYSRPVDGREREYHDWYDHTHLADVMAVPGVRSARRYRSGDTDGRYLAVYQLDGDPDQVLAEMTRRFGTEAMAPSDALDLSTISMTVWSPLG
ncbi:MAG TPA: hypothetical protein VG435_19025 [Acidimicrobiales bacterium]|nr:hypothetical protein [Acidimicrobiales bacterium]